jgi:ATP-dependent RNA helicase RhlE
LASTPALLEALDQQGLSDQPTPIQLACDPRTSWKASDLLGIAQTGTGKTAAFALPILRPPRRPSGRAGADRYGTCRALVLSPTRELAAADRRPASSTYGSKMGFSA